MNYLLDTMDGELFPATVTLDRYGGTYSGGYWTAWNEYPEDVPKEPFEDDVTCCRFWLDTELKDSDGYTKPIGKGPTAKAALEDLYAKVRELEGEEDD